jgi:SAM-dependent methyltransferase
MSASTDKPVKTTALNEQYFSNISEGEFVESSPHLKHGELSHLALNEARRIFEQLRRSNDCPTILDMGAGEGMLALPFLEMGAAVTAADATNALLDVLAARAAQFKSRLTLAPGDIFETLAQCEKTGRRFDIVCASSFLHHIPDYLKLCRVSAGLIRPGGVLFTFQDPLRYDTLGRGTYGFDRLSYFAWRVFQGNYVRGIKTRLRRLSGVYRDDLAADTAEYHVVRDGVDQESIRRLLEAEGFTCEIKKYWSTQSAIFQRLGSKLGLLNTFAIIATKRG